MNENKGRRRGGEDEVMSGASYEWGLIPAMRSWVGPDTCNACGPHWTRGDAPLMTMIAPVTMKERSREKGGGEGAMAFA